jgi:hypothetical protein
MATELEQKRQRLNFRAADINDRLYEIGNEQLEVQRRFFEDPDLEPAAARDIERDLIREEERLKTELQQLDAEILQIGYQIREERNTTPVSTPDPAPSPSNDQLVGGDLEQAVNNTEETDLRTRAEEIFNENREDIRTVNPDATVEDVYESLQRTQGIWGGEGPPSSSGQNVKQDQNARAEDSNTQNPEPETVSGSGPEPETPEEDESELENSIDTSQSIVGDRVAPDESVSIIGDRAFTPPFPVGPPPETIADDEGNESAEDFEEEVDPDVILENTTIPGEFTTRLFPKPNILSEFTSYSYSISIYLMRSGDYRNMILTGQKRLFNSTLLVQTGGTTGSSETNNSRRNRFFNDDFYIDNLDIESFITGKVNQGAHNATLIRFNITEPYGISFLDRLRDAVNDFQGSDQNLLSQTYLMVIRFYGYDEAGNLVRPENKAEETTDSNSVVEKFIPFMWESIKFTVANQLVNYECKAVAVNQYVGMGQLTSSIPYNIEISGQSLSEVVNGEAIFSDTEPTPDQTEASESDGETEAQSTKTIKQGLVAALNKFEREKAEETGSIPNEYAIKLDESVGLSNAKMAQFNEAYLANLPMDGRTNATLAQTNANIV